MLIHRLKVAKFLSFGPDGVDLPMEPLNVLIGPNGSGKSNFLEAIALLKDAPRVITDHIAREGGVRGWIWKGPQAPDSFTLEAHVGYPPGVIRHAITLADRNGRPEVTDEQIESCGTRTLRQARLRAYYRPPRSKEIESYLLEQSPNAHAPGSVVAHVHEDTIHYRRDYLPTESLDFESYSKRSCALAAEPGLPTNSALSELVVWSVGRVTHGGGRPRTL